MTDASTVPLIPREVLFGNPEKMAPRLSPDGERLAYLAPKDGVMNVWVGPVGGEIGGDDFEPVTDDRKRGIRVYFWAEDNTHIVYLQDEGGDENWRVHAVDASTKEDRDLTPFDNVQAQIVDKSRHFPDTLLVALNRENLELHDVYRLTLSTGDLDRPRRLYRGRREDVPHRLARGQCHPPRPAQPRRWRDTDAGRGPALRRRPDRNPSRYPQGPGRRRRAREDGVGRARRRRQGRLRGN